LLEPVLALFPWSAEKALSGRKNKDEFDIALFSQTAETISFPAKEDRRLGRMVTINNYHSLSASTYGKNSLDLAVIREDALEWIHSAWILVTLGIGIFLYTCMWIFLRRPVVAVIHVIGIIALFFYCTGVGGDLSDRLLRFKHPSQEGDFRFGVDFIG